MLTAYRWSADGQYLAYLAQPVAQDPLAAWSAKIVAMPEHEHAQPCIDLDSEEAHAKGMDALDLACTGTSVGTGWMWGLDVASPALRFFWARQAPLPPTELRVFESATGATHRISAEGSDVRQFDWSSKGHQLAWFSVARNEKKDENAPYLNGAGSSMSFGGEGSIAWADAGSESDAPLTLDAGAFTAIDLFGLALKGSPDGKHVALGTYQSVRVFASPAIGKTEPSELYKGRPVQFDWSADSRSLYLLRYEHHVQSLMLVDAASGSMRSATNDPRWHGKPSFSADHRTFALSVEDVTEPSRVYVGKSGSSDLREIVGHPKLNPHWAQVAPLTTGRIDWRSWDDKWDLYGVTVAPREPTPKTPRPMVVVILGAGFPTQRQFGIDTQQPVLLLAAAGYTVFIPNDRSRSGITPHGYLDLGDEHTYFSKTWQDAMQGVDLMIAKGLADADRIGIMGNSYGGGLVSWGITHTTRFKAAVLKEPVALDMAASWRNIWGHKDYGGDVIGKQYGIDNPYEGDGAKFIQYESPITNVSAVRTPTLLEFGVKSGNVQVGGNEYYQALVWYGVPAELIMYPRTIHGFVEPALVADSFRREMKWFEHWLPR
jgi:dipeptidyl aminopeptidase/acylaminoacyl peptidase